jgi:TolA-binding protein
MHVDCTRCDELLLDLAYGELDEVTAAATKKHVDGCARCGAALADVSIVREACRAIEMPEPPFSLDAAILSAARAAVVSPQSATVRHIAVDRPVSLASRFMSGFASLAMKPQMAMAAVLVVVVGVALVVTQQARAPVDEAVPSQALRAPAAPAFEPPPPASPPVVLSPVLPAEPAGVPSRPAEEPALHPIEETVPQVSSGHGSGRRSADERVARADAPLRDAPERRAGSGGDVIAKSVPSPTTPPAAGGRAQRGAAMDLAAEETTTEAERQALSGRAAFESGIGNYNRGRFRDAADDLAEFVARPGDAAGLLSTAHITRARSFKQLGLFAQAAQEYETYLSRWGSGGSAADARVEAADCYARLGQTARANELYAQAENQAGASSATRARARRSRVSLEAAESSGAAAAPSQAVDADQGF